MDIHIASLLEKAAPVVKSAKFWSSVIVGLVVLGFSIKSYFGTFANAADLKDVRASLESTKDSLADTKADVKELTSKLESQEKLLYKILDNTFEIGKKINADNINKRN